ncbi:molybdopterin molybdotransferase MoeA [Halobaculum sp. P14]|uniref:molybdopterin molybdotransferase MoeA n=1 Tax=Halobaculum sp. P14 TaxID=3421638 RepID=UPI003EC0A516
MSEERTHAGFKRRTRLAAARERLLAAATPHGRTESVPLSAADGRAVAEAVTSSVDVPGYDRAAMDGWAVRAEDTFGASDRSPAALRIVGGVGDDGNDGGESGDAVGPGEAVRVDTGAELPPGADAVVRSEDGEARGDDLSVFGAVAAGENVGERGEDVAAGDAVVEPPHWLRPSDLGLLKAVGETEVAVAEPPTVAVIPTGEELVQADPSPGEVIETNGLTVSRLAERWGAAATHRDVVTDDADALAAAVGRDTDHDVVVTTGGSSVGDRDLVPDVVADAGEVLVHGVAIKPGHPVALGRVDDTPVVMLPGYPVACIVGAVQFLRPLLAAVGGFPADPPPTRRATLTRKVRSEPGVRTFARVTLDDSDDELGDEPGESGAETEDGDAAPGSPDTTATPAAADAESATTATTETPAVTATPTRSSGAGVLSSAARADGWVVVPESREGFDAGEPVDVELWEVGR